MFPRIPSERVRSPLARSLYRIQIATVILGTGVYALLLLAPGDAPARAATAFFAALFNIITR
jgi:hypothetical protein